MASSSNQISQTSIELQPVTPTTDQAHPSADGIDPPEFLPQPSTTVRVIERWNHPKINIQRTLATFFAFVIMGANDAAYGALIPYIESYYRLTYIIVSMIFLSPLAGYALAAFLNNFIHVRFGQRGVALIGPLCHFLAYLGISLHPPYPVLVVIFILAGFGNGLEDAAWNAWAGNLANSNELLGFLHGFYGLGAVISPLLATALVARFGWHWYQFYYIMFGGASIELATSLKAFWPVSGTAYRESNPRTTAAKESRLKESLRSRVTWVASAFLLCYVGAEVALGGWIVTFMIRERQGEIFASGMVATGFWSGIAVGRLVLGAVTSRLGEKFAVMIYIVASTACQLIFWLVPQFHVSAIAVSLQGFFLGPLFPAAVVVATKSLPVHLHVSAIGFAAAFGGGGAAVLPFAIGVLAQAKGVAVLQPVILAILITLFVLWVCLPAIKHQQHGQEMEEREKPARQWFNFDFDLVDTGRRTLQKARGRGGTQASFKGTQSQQRAERREVRADRRFIKEQIRQLNRERDTPVFAVLHGIDPANELPPPYVNVRSQRF